MLSKEIVIQSLKHLPDSFSADELLDKIIVLTKVERGLKDIEEGKVFSQEEIIQQFIRK